MLEGLFEQARLASERRAEFVSVSQLEQRISALKPPVDAYVALAPAKQIKLIAEIKRRSPSKGFLADIPSAADQALKYQDFGAHAISVLTEESGFGGRLEDLELASEAVEIPLLRKDFISDEYQVLEARANGADFVLLILAWLSPSRFKELFDYAHNLGMGVLVETHTLEEIDIANQAAARLIGINTRNLETFATDIGLFERMACRLNSDAIKVAESAVRDVQDVIRYRSAGADAVLVGEALVKGDPSVLIPEFVSVT